MHVGFIANVPFLLHNNGEVNDMDAYIYRLVRIGFPRKEAKEICRDFLQRFGAVSLDEYINNLEQDAYVD